MWYYSFNGKKMGPVSFADVVNLINQRVIVPTTPVCESGKESCLAGKHPKLEGLFQMLEISQTQEQETNANPIPKIQPDNNENKPDVLTNVNDFSKNIQTKIKKTYSKLKKIDYADKGAKFKDFLIDKWKSKDFLGLVLDRRVLVILGILLVGFVALFTISSIIFNPGEKYYALSTKYEEGIGVRKNEVLAFKYLKKAAQCGHVKAQFELGECYELGTSVKQDYKEAVKWYRKAANKGHAEAQYSLGMNYAIGEGVKEDEREACKWITKSAKQGYGPAQAVLARWYYFGYNGITKDKEQALEWAQKALANGETDVHIIIDGCYGKH